MSGSCSGFRIYSWCWKTPCFYTRSFLPKHGFLCVYCECGFAGGWGVGCVFSGVFFVHFRGRLEAVPGCVPVLCAAGVCRDWGLTHVPGVIPISWGTAGCKPGFGACALFPQTWDMCLGSARAQHTQHGRVGRSWALPVPLSVRLQLLNGSKRIALWPLKYSWEYSLYCNCALCYLIYFFF